MNRLRFRVQVAAVAALVVLVGWPRFRPAPAVTVWASRAPAPQPELVLDDPRVRAAEDSGSSFARAIPDEPRSISDLGAKVDAIVGRARTLANQPVPYARVTLRDASSGRIAARTTADRSGRFVFLDVTSGGYVLELTGADGSAIATSGLVTVSDGDLQQATVRLAANSSVRAVFGSSPTTATAQETMTRAVQNATRSNSDETTDVSPSH
jgi:hypothetical protein